MILKTSDLKLISDFLTGKEIKRVNFSIENINSVEVLQFQCEDFLKKEYSLFVYPTKMYKEHDLYKSVQISTTEKLEKAVKS